MIDWPETLVAEIVGQRCVLFLGSGVSAGSKNMNGASPPSWGELLDLAVELVKDANLKTLIQELIKERRYLVALQAIKQHSDPAGYSALLTSKYNSPYLWNVLHETIYALDSRIVITTNFDKIYENYCNSFQGGSAAYKTISYRQEDLADELRSDTRLIIKAHGTIDAATEMIFTRSEYHEAKRKHGTFYDVLKAIFLTNTIVFIGCGLDDPDILLLLEDVSIAGRSRKTHYALVLDGEKNKLVIDDWRQTYNIQVLGYGPTHGQLGDELKNLLAMVQAKRAQSIGGPS